MVQPKPGEVYWVDLGLKGKVRPRLGRRAGRFEPSVVAAIPKQIAWMIELLAV